MIDLKVEFTLKQDIKGPLAVYYELDNFYQVGFYYIYSSIESS